MTYCVGMLLDAGLVFLSDSRTNAGVDQISTFRKVTIFERSGDRVMVLLTAGNLAIARIKVTADIACWNPGAATAGYVDVRMILADTRPSPERLRCGFMDVGGAFFIAHFFT